MKHSLRLPLGFLLKMIGFSVLFALLKVLYAWLPVAEGGGLPEGFLIYTVAADLPALILASAMLAFVASLFSIVKRPGVKLLSFLLLVLVSWPTVYFSMMGAAILSRSVRRAEARMAAPFIPGQIYRTRSGLVRLGARSGAIARNIILIEKNGAPSFHEEAVYDHGSGTLRALETFAQIIDRVDPNPLTMHPILGLWLTGLEEMSADMSPADAFDPEILISMVGLGLALLSLWLFVRFSRWPLFNFFLVLGLLWAIVALYQAAGVAAHGLAQRVGLHDAYVGLVLPVLKGSAAAFMLVLCIFRRPLGDWRKEMGYE